MADKALLERVEAILKEHRVCVLATLGGGQPWASSVYYAEDGFDLYCIVEDHSIKFKNMKENPKVAFTLDHQTPLTFLQGAGTAEILVREEDVKAGMDLVLVKAPEIGNFMKMFPCSVVRIRPERFQITDIPRGVFPAQVIAL